MNDGVKRQRFICCFGPLNFYMQDVDGDVKALPSASFLSKFILSPDEVLCIDGEDVQSCFNLFTMPPAWRGYMVFEKRVPRAVLDLPGGGDTFVAVTIVPMGWSASVDLIQCFFRRFVGLRPS